MFRLVSTALVLTFISTLIACEREAPPAANPPAKSAAVPAALPSALFLAAAPADPKDIKDAKPALKAGDKVVLVGRIGGSVEPFVAERAIFTLVDRRMLACGEDSPDDTCPTPWDFCCEPRKDLTANSVTIQVVGPDAQPIKAELNGVRGLKPLATVTVVGVVTKAEGEGLVVSATQFYVKP
jgi:hypothetical protein